MVVTAPDGAKSIFIMYDPWVATGDAAWAVSYLNDVNLYYKNELADPEETSEQTDAQPPKPSPYSVEDFEPDENGDYHFVIAGHRRDIAVEIALGLIGRDIETYPMQVQSLRNVSFIVANSVQGIENNHVTPPTRDQAEDIHRYYEFYLSKFGITLSAEQIGEAKGYKPAKVANALKYARLPDEIKQAEKTGEFSYSVAVTFGELQALYARRAKQQFKASQNAVKTDSLYEKPIITDLETGKPKLFETPEEQAKYETFTVYIRLQHILTDRKREGRTLSNAERIKIIEQKKALVRAELAYDEELFLSEDARPEAKRAVVIQGLSGVALKGIELVLKHGTDAEFEAMRDSVIEAIFKASEDRVSVSVVDTDASLL
jgi:hypothetical protein